MRLHACIFFFALHCHSSSDQRVALHDERVALHDQRVSLHMIIHASTSSPCAHEHLAQIIFLQLSSRHRSVCRQHVRCRQHFIVHASLLPAHSLSCMCQQRFRTLKTSRRRRTKSSGTFRKKKIRMSHVSARSSGSTLAHSEEVSVSRTTSKMPASGLWTRQMVTSKC